MRFTNYNKDIIIKVDVIHGPCSIVVLGEVCQSIKISNPLIFELRYFTF